MDEILKEVMKELDEILEEVMKELIEKYVDNENALFDALHAGNMKECELLQAKSDELKSEIVYGLAKSAGYELKKMNEKDKYGLCVYRYIKVGERGD